MNRNTSQRQKCQPKSDYQPHNSLAEDAATTLTNFTPQLAAAVAPLQSSSVPMASYLMARARGRSHQGANGQRWCSQCCKQQNNSRCRRFGQQSRNAETCTTSSRCMACTLALVQLCISSKLPYHHSLSASQPDAVHYCNYGSGAAPCCSEHRRQQLPPCEYPALLLVSRIRSG
jgi:hypothetical protein